MSDTLTAVLLPFGQTAGGRMVQVSEVERGLACGCVCPQCGKPLIARKGDVLVHHFAHAADSDCKGAVESALHKMAKQILCDQKQVRVPDAIAEYQHTRQHVLGTRTYVAHECFPERSFGQIKPDVFFEGGGSPLAIEVYVTHRVSDEKRLLLSMQKFNSVEIEMAKWIGCDNVETIAAAVLWTAPRHWLHHDGIARAVTRMRDIATGNIPPAQTKFWDRP